MFCNLYQRKQSAFNVFIIALVIIFHFFLTNICFSQDTNNNSTQEFTPVFLHPTQEEMEERKLKEEDEKRREEENKRKLQEIKLDEKEKTQLERWTHKKCSDVLFDSDKDNWSQNTSVFDSKIMLQSPYFSYISCKFFINSNRYMLVLLHIFMFII